MADKILVEFKTDLDKFRKDLDEVKSRVTQVGNESGKAGKQTTKSFQKSEVAASKFNDGVKNIGASMVAAFSVQLLIGFGKAIIDVTAQFQKLEAVLTNTLGSKSLAQQALYDIQQFAATTPFSVAEASQAFLKLANNGIKPTIKEMRAFADLSANAGKGIDMFAEAVNDATRGEFERLKEFFISGKTLADKYQFTFKGVTYETEKNAKAVKDLLAELGQVPGVMGATDAISKTLTGQISNLGDQWDMFLTQLGKGNTGVISNSITLMSDFVELLRKAKMSDQDILDETKMKESAAAIENGTEQFKVYISEMRKAEGANFNLIKSTEKYRDDLNKTIEKQKEELNVIEARNKGLKASSMLSEKAKDEEKNKKITINSLYAERQGVLNLVNSLIDEEKAREDLANKTNEEKRIKEIEIENKKKESDATKELTKALKDEAKEKEKHKDDGLNSMVAQLERQIEVDDEWTKTQESNDKAQLDSMISTLESEVEADQKHNDAMEKSNAEMNAQKKRQNEELAQASLQVATQLSNAIFEINQRNLDQEYNGKINSLEKQRDAELNFKGATESDKARINAQYDAKRKKILTEQFEANKKAAIIQTNINGAIAVVGALPNYILAAAVGVTTAIQLGLIASQPTPEFHTGGVDINPRKKNRKGEFDAKLIEGESVIHAKATGKWKQELEAMNSMKYEDLVMAKYVIPVLRKQQEEITKHQGAMLGNNIAQSIALNGGKFNDGNIVQWLNIVNKTSKENAKIISKSLGNRRNYARSV